MDIIGQTKAKMLQAIEHFKNELKNLRTGRANPGMIEGLHVEVYGAKMRLMDIATISAPEPRLLVVSPFDPSNLNIISKAIQDSNLGLRPAVTGHQVNVSVDEMSQENRQRIIRVCHEKKEECKIGLRNIRRESNDSIKKQKADGEIPEDLQRKMEKSVQELTDKYCKEVDDLASKKEGEISKI